MHQPPPAAPPAAVRVIRSTLIGHMGTGRDTLVALVADRDGRHRVGVRADRSHCSCGRPACIHAAVAGEGWFPRPARD